MAVPVYFPHIFALILRDHSSLSPSTSSISRTDSSPERISILEINCTKVTCAIIDGAIVADHIITKFLYAVLFTFPNVTKIRFILRHNVLTSQPLNTN